jgi:hypothetical protein
MVCRRCGPAYDCRTGGERASRKRVAVNPGDKLGRIGRIGPVFSAALPQPFGRELFGVTAALDQGGLQRGNLAVKQVVGLVEEADQGIGPHGGIGVLEPSAWRAAVST